MSIISYAQNFEDVMLWRALGHINKGFYIDVGAQHPILDSVSNAFYKQGWRGVHVEPTESYAAMLREARPDELIIQAALSDKAGTILFYEIAESGLSTGDASIAAHHKSRGYTVLEKTVHTITLDDLFDQISSPTVHWLKIDVEGMEQNVLSGWNASNNRPLVVVVESTYPNSQIATYLEWEELILVKGYTHQYFDGLNRYYISNECAEIIKYFKVPPNIFDGFQLASSSPYNAIARKDFEEKEQDKLILLDAAHAEITRLKNQITTMQVGKTSE